tara:strand:- start:1634 stop:1855 length:222 start_codon:yes stop_codon:yes gene_type:complete
MQRDNEAVKLKEARAAKNRLDEIKFLLKTARITYDEAEAMSREPLKKLNAGMEVLSKRFRSRHRKVSFIGFMR